jgi:hypothetical protein
MALFGIMIMWRAQIMARRSNALPYVSSCERYRKPPTTCFPFHARMAIDPAVWILCELQGSDLQLWALPFPFFKASE